MTAFLFYLIIRYFINFETNFNDFFVETNCSTNPTNHNERKSTPVQAIIPFSKSKKCLKSSDIICVVNKEGVVLSKELAKKTDRHEKQTRFIGQQHNEVKKSGNTLVQRNTTERFETNVIDTVLKKQQPCITKKLSKKKKSSPNNELKMGTLNFNQDSSNHHNLPKPSTKSLNTITKHSKLKTDSGESNFNYTKSKETFCEKKITHAILKPSEKFVPKRTVRINDMVAVRQSNANLTIPGQPSVGKVLSQGNGKMVVHVYSGSKTSSFWPMMCRESPYTREFSISMVVHVFDLKQDNTLHPKDLDFLSSL